MLTSNSVKEDSMVAKASIIKNYAKADAAGKVDIICKNYSNFIGIVDGYTEGLCYMIENEKAYNRKQSRGDLGIRVQTSGMHSDITADTAISNVITKDAIIACDFSGDVLEGVDRGEEFQRDAYTLRSMRTDFALFNRQLSILSGNELRIFKGYLSGEKDIGDIAEEEGIQYESAAQKVRRAKVKIKVQMIGFLEGIA
jgi:hypothetical protein